MSVMVCGQCFPRRTPTGYKIDEIPLDAGMLFGENGLVLYIHKLLITNVWLGVRDAELPRVRGWGMD